MTSKLRFSLIALLMIVLFGFGLQDQAKGQPGEDLQFCPGVPISNGWLDTEIDPATPAPDFSAALIGTVEGSGGANVAGLDWMHQNFDIELQVERQFDPFSFVRAFTQFLRPTNQVGAQLVTWWSQKEGRNTYVQVTNYNGGTKEDIFGTPFVDVHVRILDENCVELRDFCDTYTVEDTHVYNLGDLVLNNGQTRDDSILQGEEGFLVVTAVDGCPSPDRAIDYNFLAGNMTMIDANDYEYGINMYARAGLCIPTTINIIDNGSFQNELSSWIVRQSPTVEAVTATDFSPNVPVPLCTNFANPDCSDPDADVFQAFLASDDDEASNRFYGEFAPLGSALAALANPALINQGPETNVTVLESSSFFVDPTPLIGPFGECESGVEYDIQVFNPSDIDAFLGCDNYTAVCTIDIDGTPFFEDCDIFNATGNGSILQNSTSGGVISETFGLGDDNFTYAYNLSTLEMQGGKSALIHRELEAFTGNTYIIHVITGQEDGVCATNGFFDGVFGRGTNGAVVDNFELLCIDDECGEIGFGDHVLDGVFSFLLPVIPDKLAGQFNVLAGNEGNAGADVVHINFADQYLPEYRPLAAFIDAQVGIWDDVEEFTSCGDANVCFIRLGIDADIVISDEFSPVSPSPSPVSPTPTPTIGPVSPTPTPTVQPRGSSDSCAIAGGPVHLGTAMANVLIPLVPLAFAFGVRAIRRRKK